MDTHTSPMSFAVEAALQAVLIEGTSVPSVTGPLSKASNFGSGDRPWIELIGYAIEAPNDVPAYVSSQALPLHVPYLFGLLAWTLDGRDDLDTLAYYRPVAADFSDDGSTMCGAFGARMQSSRYDGNQLRAVMQRIESDSATRRTFVPIIEARDNISESKEYPCAAGVQLFLRDGYLHWLTLMRAQQALTILPYDVGLFALLHQFYASELRTRCGVYRHFSGTFHIYENEVPLARRVLSAGIAQYSLPHLPSGSGAEAAQELIAVERDLRDAALAGDLEGIRRLQHAQCRFDLVSAIKAQLAPFALSRVQRQ